MNIITALNRMEEIEKKASELYKHYQGLFHGDQEAAYFFYRMHLEEKGHRNLIQYVKKLVRQNPRLFHDLDVTEEELGRIVAMIDSQLERKKQPKLDEAVEIAEELEIALAEGYLKNLPLKNNRILLDLYGALGEKDHTEKITAFKAKVGVRD